MTRESYFRVRAALEGVATLVLPAIAAGCSVDMAGFLALIFRPDVTKGKQLAHPNGVISSTLVSRFHRAGLPSVKRYIIGAQMVKIAVLVESCPDVSVKMVAGALGWASPQSFGRFIHQRTRRTALEFCAYADREAIVAEYRATLVLPYLEILRDFRPLSAAQTRTLRERFEARRSATLPVLDVAV